MSVSAQGYSPTFVYQQEYIEGFSVLIHPDAVLQKAALQNVRDELALQFKAISRVMPNETMRFMRQVPIWVEWQSDPNGAAVFHPSRQWLLQNGYNPDKANGIELSNAVNFVNWSRTDQPWMVLHELTHAYHYMVLGEANPDIAFAYQQAMALHLYDSVDYVRGGKKQAYAVTSAREYFAELSEAYFGRNDHYPFNRNDLQRHDPVGYQLMVKAWGRLR